MESMRSVGYTLEAALADLVDNSISAGCTEVDIEFSTEPYEYVSIVDNGSGMSLDGARLAMRLAGMSPLADRREDDLGRFGLGLKTASLSQCRDLTLVTLGPDGLVALEWDLDHLARTGRWSVKILDAEEARRLPGTADVMAQGRGTMVLWRSLDALRAQVGDDTGFDRAMLHAREHLQLVFHRFIAGEHGRSFQIRMNGQPLDVVDPFLQSHKATAKGPEETFRVDGSTVRVRPFTLPHLARLSTKDRQRAMLAGSLRDTQGFYVYRAQRLVIWGTWFRIRPKEDLSKLARVRVDIPNTLDHLWALDIKKSAAQPPPEVRQRLRRFGEKMVEPSQRTFTYRGRKADDPVIRAWNLVENGAEFRYEINRDHPLLSAVADRVGPDAVPALQQYLRLLELSFPADDLFSRLSSDAGRANLPASEDEHLEQARALWAAFRSTSADTKQFVSIMRQVEPFSELVDAESLLLRATEGSDQ